MIPAGQTPARAAALKQAPRRRRSWRQGTKMPTKRKYKEIDGHRVPVIPNIHQAVYAAAKLPKALDMNEWHTCKTTHCRAGWVVILAGTAGKKLEQACETSAMYGTRRAAWLIYRASDPSMRFEPSFGCSERDALADMKSLAEQEAARRQTNA